MKKFFKKTYKGIPVIIIFIAVFIIGSGGMFAAIYLGGQGEIALQKGLVGHWKMDGNAKDSTPYENNGTIFESSTTTDRKGQDSNAYYFDGSNDYINLGNSTDFDFSTGDFTISVWAKATSGTNGRGIINKGGWGSNGYYISEAYSPAYIYYFGVRDSSGYKVVQLPLQEVWDWTHIVGIKTENHIEAWVNGNYIGQWNGTIGSLSNPSKNLEIGRSFNPSYFNGSIDDVRIYNRALSSDEITALYESYDPRIQVSDTQKGLVGYWKMDGNVKDGTPYNNNGVLYGSPSYSTDRKEQSNGSIDFDDTQITQYISLPYTVLDGLSDFTITFWAYGGGTDEWIISGSDGTDHNHMLMAGPTTSGWHFYTWRRGSVYGTHAYRDLVQDDALIWSYPDGNPSDPINLAEGGLIIGQEQDSLGGGFQASQAFSGKISDLRIYNKALSSEELEAIYESYNSEIKVSDTQKGLVGYWKMDGNAKDFTPYNNNGTISGAIPGIDRKEQENSSLNFNGSSDYISFPVTQLYALSQATISMWIKPDNFTQWKGLIYIRENGSTDYLIIRNDGDGLQLLIEDDNITEVNAATPALSASVWTHILFIQDGTGWKFYKDGILSTLTGTNSSYCMDHLTITDIRIGYSAWAESYYDGFIDDVRIYNRALSEDEIRMLYESYQ